MSTVVILNKFEILKYTQMEVKNEPYFFEWTKNKK